MERNTRQRNAIREAFMAANQPLTPADVLAVAKAAVTDMSLATVYRNINALVEANWLNSVELPGESPRYERAGGGHHHHFQCRGCGTVFAIRECPSNLARLTPPGFILESHEVILYGRCQRCAT
jgi:Fur family ferric uptake transcriptional regulator